MEIKNTKKILEQIRLLVFGDDSEKLTPEVPATTEAVIAPEVTEEKKPEDDEKKDTPEAIAEAPETIEAVTPEVIVAEVQLAENAPASFQDQLDAMTKQLETLSQFSMMKERLDYLSKWVEGQIVKNENFSSAFSKLVDLTESIAGEGTGEAIVPVKESFSEIRQQKKERMTSFISEIRNKKKAEAAKN